MKATYGIEIILDYDEMGRSIFENTKYQINLYVGKTSICHRLDNELYDTEEMALDRIKQFKEQLKRQG